MIHTKNRYGWRRIFATADDLRALIIEINLNRSEENRFHPLKGKQDPDTPVRIQVNAPDPAPDEQETDTNVVERAIIAFERESNEAQAVESIGFHRVVYVNFHRGIGETLVPEIEAYDVPLPELESLLEPLNLAIEKQGWFESPKPVSAAEVKGENPEATTIEPPGPINLQLKPPGRHRDKLYNDAARKIKNGQDYKVVYQWFLVESNCSNPDRGVRGAFKQAMTRRGVPRDRLKESK